MLPDQRQRPDAEASGTSLLARPGKVLTGQRVYFEPNCSARGNSLMKLRARLCWVLLLLFVCPVFASTKPITLYTKSSEPFMAYVAGPEGATAAVVLVHDWFGVSPFYAEA